MDTKIHIALPGDKLPESYFQTRYEILRKPLGFPPNTAHLPNDTEALHVWLTNDKGCVIAVGRSHLLDAETAGGGSDHGGDDTQSIPPFTPLLTDVLRDGELCEIPPVERLFPAVQFRQMGVVEPMRRQGLGRLLLLKLEEESVRQFKARSGWLQSRIAYGGYYESEQWTAFGEQYNIPKIGPHLSFYKLF